MAPTLIPYQGTLLDIGGVDFGRIGIRERKERLFAYIYYSNMSLDEALKSKTFLGVYAPSAIFGHERTLSFLGGTTTPVTKTDIAAATEEYQTFVARFDSEGAKRYAIDYVVAAFDADLLHINHWYALGPCQRVSNLCIYRATAK